MLPRNYIFLWILLHLERMIMRQRSDWPSLGFNFCKVQIFKINNLRQNLSWAKLMSGVVFALPLQAQTACDFYSTVIIWTVENYILGAQRFRVSFVGTQRTASSILYIRKPILAFPPSFTFSSALPDMEMPLLHVFCFLLSAPIFICLASFKKLTGR